MQITIDTSYELSEFDIQVLQLLLGETAEAPAEPAAAAKPVAAKKAAAAKPAAAEEAPAEPDEDLLGGAPTLADAVALATKLVSSGDSAKVKAALADLGVKRVSELKPEDVAGFIEALNA